ncbi:putative methyltransferase, LIC12133 family [Pseudomonas straminea]|uniref:Putative methyltransferase, LIC12133 family n=1 Tax=Pseudomonas straminea TaxID=47882 RepID=A0A1I1SQL8_PSEOC|nr:putative methyltransferase, LIC12133 family [Pseudomonas straminea]
MRRLIKLLLPPIFISVYRALFHKKYGFYGNYSSWQEAESQCEGYSSVHIFDRVKKSAQLVKDEKYFCERDSVLFDSPQYSWPSLACLMNVAAQNKGRLSVLDFGGSLGSAFFQNRRFLENLSVEWSVVEQPHFVSYGAKEIAGNGLQFFSTLAQCAEQKAINVVFLSGVLQYLPNPYQLLDEILSYGFPFVILDRTPFGRAGYDILKIQIVDPSIYVASYPVWLLDESLFCERLHSHGYTIVEEFSSNIDWQDASYTFKGFLIKKNS